MQGVTTTSTCSNGETRGSYIPREREEKDEDLLCLWILQNGRSERSSNGDLGEKPSLTKEKKISWKINFIF